MENTQGGKVTKIRTGETLVVESGGTLQCNAGATVSLADASESPNDIALVDAHIMVGDAAGKAADVAMSGDVTITNTGVTAIGANKVTTAKILDGAVTGAKWSAGAGVAAVLSAGLGGSASVTKTSAATTTVVAANATKDRACLVVVTVDETYAVGTGTLPTVKIGEDDSIEKCMAATVLDTEAAGTVLVFAFTNLATKKIIVTTTAAIGNSTGGCSVAVIAIPTT